MSDTIEVWLDSDLMPPAFVGTLIRGAKGNLHVSKRRPTAVIRPTRLGAGYLTFVASRIGAWR